MHGTDRSIVGHINVPYRENNEYKVRIHEFHESKSWEEFVARNRELLDGEAAEMFRSAKILILPFTDSLMPRGEL